MAMIERPKSVERRQKIAKIALKLPWPLKPFVNRRIEKESNRIKAKLLKVKESEKVQKEMNKFFEEPPDLKTEEGLWKLEHFLINNIFQIKSPIIRWEMTRRCSAKLKGISLESEKYEKIGVEELLKDAFKRYAKTVRQEIKQLAGDTPSSGGIDEILKYSSGRMLYSILSTMIMDNLMPGGLGIEGAEKAKETFGIPVQRVHEWYNEVKREMAEEQAQEIIAQNVEKGMMNREEGKERKEKLKGMSNSGLLGMMQELGKEERVEAAKSLILSTTPYYRSILRDLGERRKPGKTEKDTLVEILKSMNDEEVLRHAQNIVERFTVLPKWRLITPEMIESEREILDEHIAAAPTKVVQELFLTQPDAGIYPDMMPPTLLHYGGKEQYENTMKEMADSNNTKFHNKLIGERIYQGSEKKELSDKELNKRIEYWLQYLQDAGFTEQQTRTMMENGIRNTELKGREELVNRALSQFMGIYRRRRIQNIFAEKGLYRLFGAPRVKKLKERIENCLLKLMPVTPREKAKKMIREVIETHPKLSKAQKDIIKKHIKAH